MSKQIKILMLYRTVSGKWVIRVFLTFGQFDDVAVVEYIVFMRNRDECLKEFNNSDAVELFVHHTDLTELVSFESVRGDCGVLICRQTCCPEAVKSHEGLYVWLEDDWYECVASKESIYAITRVYVDHDVPEDISRNYIMSQVVTPRQYAMQLGYPQEELATLSPEVYMKDDMLVLIEFINKRRTEV